MEIILNPQRFDLMAKYLYIKHYDKNLNCSFFKDLYIKHFITFNNCFEYPIHIYLMEIQKKHLMIS